MWIYLVLFILTLLLIKWYTKITTSIPGYNGLPLLGILPFLDANPAETFIRWSEKLGPIFHVKFGTTNAIVLNDYESIYKCMVDHGMTFADRPVFHMMDGSVHQHGVGLVDNSNVYKTNKKLVTTSIRRFVGDVEAKISEEMSFLFKEIDSHKGKSFNIKASIQNCYVSIIGGIIFGKRLGWGNKMLIEMTQMLNALFNNNEENIYIHMLLLFERLKYLPFFSGVYKRFRANYDRQHEILKDVIKEHRASRVRGNIRDMVDLFLQNQENEPDNPAHTDVELQYMMQDIFNAGVDTVTASTMWLILYLAENEEIQEKLYQEINEHIGGETPTYRCSEDMPLMLSVMDEVSRHRTIVSLSVSRKNSKAITISNVHFPSGNMIMPNLWAVHHSSKYFNEPYKMIPDRFIDKTSGKFVKSPYVIPFGIGVRKCLGYKLAQKKIFLLLCSFLQTYKILQDSKDPLPDFNDGMPGIVYFARPFKIRCEKRKRL